jgi:hypothetical protein
MRQGSRYWVVVGTVALLLGWWGMVRGVPSTTIRFSHKLHLGEDVEAECTMCHPAEESASASDRLLPTMEICGECHDVEDDDGCATCHLDLDIVGEIDVPSREIVFSHQSHLGYDGTACTTCHAGLEEVEAPGGDHIPGMVTCWTCHDGSRATEECGICHTDLTDLRPESHLHDWTQQHGQRVRTGDTGCTPCHGQAECQECHEGAQLSVALPPLGSQASFAPQVLGNAGLILKGGHDLNYRFTHAIDAKGKERECTACHETASFCVECHRPGSRPDHFRPAWHGGPRWGAMAGAVGSGGGLHADLARRDMERCAACHDVQGQDPVCMLCHMDRTPGLGNDPKTHGSRFRSRAGYGDFHDDRGSICYNCHPSGRIGAGSYKVAAGGPGFCGYCHGPK